MITRNKKRLDAIDIDELREKLTYDPKTGLLMWATSGNGVRKGEIAGTKNEEGYIRIKVFFAECLAHRLIWFYVTGRWPEHEIDHKDRDRANNRWTNLREATDKQNRANTRGWGRHGVKGVKFKSRLKMRPWEAYIKQNGRYIHLGLFATKEEAHQAWRKAAAKMHGAFFAP